MKVILIFRWWKKSIPIEITFIEKIDDINRSILYGFDGPFQLLHADVGNLKFLGKCATNPKYCLLFFDFFTLKVYVCPMKTRKLTATKIDIFYKEVWGKKKRSKNKASKGSGT